MLNKNQIPTPLQPYFKNFFYIYSGLIVTAAILVCVLSYLGSNFNQLTNTAIGASALIMATLIISKQFASKQRRFFNAQELHKMVLGTTSLSCLLQIIILGLYLLFIKNFSTELQDTAAFMLKDVSSNQVLDIFKVPFSSWCITFAATFTITFFLQSVNFRLIARRAIHRKITA